MTAEATPAQPSATPVNAVPAAQASVQVTTLGQLGRQLPVGVLGPNGTMNKDFSLLPFRLREEKLLQDIKSDQPNIAMPRYATLIMAQMVASVGGEDFSKKSPVERQLFLTQMYMPDVLYMYVYLRFEAMGKELGLKLTCPRCREPYDWNADLSTMEVRTVSDPAALRRKFTLGTGFTLRGKLVKVVETGPVCWSALDGHSTLALGAIKANILRDSIVGVEGVKQDEFSPVPEAALDDMTKRDVELLTKHIDGAAFGPMVVVESKHSIKRDGSKACGTTYTTAMDWSFDSFFGFSSL